MEMPSKQRIVFVCHSGMTGALAKRKFAGLLHTHGRDGYTVENATMREHELEMADKLSDADHIVLLWPGIANELRGLVPKSATLHTPQITEDHSWIEKLIHKIMKADGHKLQ